MKKTASWPETVWTALAMAWMALFPLWQDGSYTRLTRAKLIGMGILTGVSLAVLAVTWIFLKQRRETCRHTRLATGHMLFAAYLSWVVLSAFLGSWVSVTNDRGLPAVWFGAVRYEGALTQLCYGAIFLVMSLIPAKFSRWLPAAAVSLLLYCGLVLVQYTGGNPLGLFPGTLRFPGFFEFQGTLGNTNMVSAYLSMLLPLLALGYTETGNPLLLTAACVGTLLMTCLEVQSGLIALGALAVLLTMVLLWNRGLRRRAAEMLAGILFAVLLRQAIYLPWFDEGPVLGLVWKRIWLPPAGLVLSLAGIRMLDRWKGRLRGKTVLLLLCGLVLLTLLLIFLLPIPESQGGLWELHEVLRGRPQDSFGTWRLGVWRWTVELAGENPVFGTGPDTFYYSMKDYMVRNGLATRERYDTPHNWLLGILSGSGWPALGLFLGMLGSTLAQVWKHRNRQGMLALGAAIVCFLVQGMFTFSICIISPMFYALLGMACCEIQE